MPRLGFGLHSKLPLSLMTEATKIAEERGYEVCWVPGEETPGKEIPSLIAAMAMSTSKIKFGTGILTIFTRPPTLMAQTAISLDEVSDGRFILGLGSGHSTLLEKNHGIILEKPFGRMREYVHVVREVMKNGKCSYQGKIFNIPNFELACPPPERDIPVYMAALGPQMSELAGEISDGVLFNMGTVEYFQEVIPRVKAAAEQAGRDPNKVDIASLIYATTGGAEAEKLCKESVAYYIQRPFYRKLLNVSGFAEDVERIKNALDEGGVEAGGRKVSDKLADALTLIGDTSTWSDKLERFRSAGVDLPCPFFYPSGDDPVGSVLEGVKALRG